MSCEWWIVHGEYRWSGPVQTPGEPSIICFPTWCVRNQHGAAHALVSASDAYEERPGHAVQEMKASTLDKTGHESRNNSMSSCHKDGQRLSVLETTRQYIRQGFDTSSFNTSQLQPKVFNLEARQWHVAFRFSPQVVCSPTFLLIKGKPCRQACNVGILPKDNMSKPSHSVGPCSMTTTGWVRNLGVL